jgi:hypothetical protein
MGIGGVPAGRSSGLPTPFCGFLRPNESLTSDLDGRRVVLHCVRC